MVPGATTRHLFTSWRHFTKLSLSPAGGCTVSRQGSAAAKVGAFLAVPPGVDRTPSGGRRRHLALLRRLGARRAIPPSPGHFMDTPCHCPAARTPEVQKITGICWRHSVWRGEAARRDRQTAAWRSVCGQWKWNIGSKHHIPPPRVTGVENQPVVQPGRARWPLLFQG